MSSDKSHKKLFWHYVKSKQEDIFGSVHWQVPLVPLFLNHLKRLKFLMNISKSIFTAEDLSNVPDKGTSPYLSIPEINITLEGNKSAFKL